MRWIAYVHISSPEDLAFPDLGDDVLAGLGLCHRMDNRAVARGHGKVGQEGESGDEGCQNVEQAFLLHTRESIAQ